MRKIVKSICLSFGGRETGFRLTKPDAFSGVFLLRQLMNLPEESGTSPVSDFFL